MRKIPYLEEWQENDLKTLSFEFKKKYAVKG